MLQSEASRLRILEVSNLPEPRVGVDQGASRYLHQPWAQGIHGGKVQQEICRGANIKDGIGAWAEPLRRMSIVVRPAVRQPHSRECARRKLQAKVRILIGDVSDRVIAGGIIVAILDEVYVVPQQSQTHHVLQVMPGQAA